MTDILLITDKPHIQKIFVDLANAENIPLRVTSALEDGSKELTSAKPSIVFVQAYLSGLSPKIIFTHLKKLLGRRRTRFVLLSASGKIDAGSEKLFHACVDVSLDEQAFITAIRAAIDDALTKKKKTQVSVKAPAEKTSLPSAHETARDTPDEPPEHPSVERIADITEISSGTRHFSELESGPTPRKETFEHSLEEQGVVYAPKQQKTTYSEFTETFSNAVHEISGEKPDPPASQEVSRGDLSAGDVSSVSPQSRSKLSSFMIWLLPALLIVVAVTFLQHHLTKPKSIDKTPLLSEKSDAPPFALPSETIADSQGRKQANSISPTNGATRTSPRVKPPITLPAFIPSGALDASYGNSNPGWERYAGKSTEFKVYRGERKEIKAIQVIDQSNKGISEAFMRDVLKQLTGSASFASESIEKQEEYRIQRVKLAGNISAVIYRDVKGETLRGFVVSWP